MNKTQTLLVERLEGKHGAGSAKQGWSKTGNFIRLQNFREIDQAYKLKEQFPEKYETKTHAFKLVDLIKIGE
jgi:hypothetical protein